VLDEMLRKDGTVAAVTHGGFIRRAVFDILGFPEERAWPFGIANCSITEIVMDRAGNRGVHRLNDACHLD
jgi:broad specificity phosphatase PhoE